MKKPTLLLSIFCFTCFVSQAQFEKNQKVLSGSLSFSANNSSYEQLPNQSMKSSAVSFSPSLGWFTKPNHLVGVGVTFSRNSNRNYSSSNEQKQTNNAVGIAVYSQRFVPIMNKLFFTLQANAGAQYLFGKFSTNTGQPAVESEDRTSGFGINAGLAPGVSYRINQRFLVDLSLSNLLSVGYTREKLKNIKPGTNVNPMVRENYYFSSSLTNSSLGGIGVGFRYLLKP